MPKYLVVSATQQQLYTTEEPQDAVRAFFHEYPHHGLKVEVSVFVADFIGNFRRETVITRQPNPPPPPKVTKPDSPNALDWDDYGDGIFPTGTGWTSRL